MEIENQPSETQEPSNIPLQEETKAVQPDPEQETKILDSVVIEVESMQKEEKPEPIETEPEALKEPLAEAQEVANIVMLPIEEEQDSMKEREHDFGDLEHVKTRNTTSVDEKAEDSKGKGGAGSHQAENMDTEDAIRELDELFNSGEDTTKDPISPAKENAEPEEDNQIKIKTTVEPVGKNKEFASQPTSSKKSQEKSRAEREAKQRKKRGRKKLVEAHENKIDEAIQNDININPLFAVNEERKFKIPNKDLTTEQLKERYNDIIYHFRCESEVACLICLDDEVFPQDDIIICDLCSCAFHQSCYGSDLLKIADDDDSEWYCQRCSHLLKNDLSANTIKCCFCPELKEPMKRVRNSSSNEWAHIACVNWIPEIYYEEELEKQNVYITEYKTNKHCGRKNLQCAFCKIRYGDCIQCDTEKCIRSFHVTCAQKHGLICNWKEMNSMKRDQDTEFYTPIYCKHHMQLYSAEMFAFSNNVEERNKSRGVEVSLLWNPTAISKTSSKDKKHKSKKASQDRERSLETEFDSQNIKPFSTGGDVKKKKLRKLQEKAEDHKKIEKAKDNKTLRKRPALKSVLKETMLEEEVKCKIIETNEETAEKSEIEAHYEDKENKMECSNSKGELDSTSLTINARGFSPIVAVDEGKGSIPKSRKQVEGVIVSDFKPENNSAKKEKPEKKEKRRDKVEHAEKSNKRDKPDKLEKEAGSATKSNSRALYKFRPNMAKLLMYNGWGTEKEMKRVISDYIKAKGLYRKDEEEVDIAKDPQLEEIMGLERISRKHIFTEFMHFMLKKSPEEVLRDDFESPLYSAYEEEYRKMKEKQNAEKMNEEEDNQGERKIKKKPAFTNSSINARKEQDKGLPRHSEHLNSAKIINSVTSQTNIKQPERPFQQLFGKDGLGWQPTTSNHAKAKPHEKESNLDFFEWAPKQNENKTSSYSNESKLASLHPNIQTNNGKNIIPARPSHQEYVSEKEPPIAKKVKTNPSHQQKNIDLSTPPPVIVIKEERPVILIKEERPAPVAQPKKNDPYDGMGPLINKVDKMPLRRTMNWFVKTDTSLVVSSINSQAARERFWPRGANMLF